MRIALVVTGGVDASGRDKVIPLLLSLIERLARRHEVVVFALRYLAKPTTYPLLGSTVVDLGRPEGIWRQYSALVDAMRRAGPFDVVHGYWALPAGLVAAMAGRRLGVSSIVTFDSGEFVAIPDIKYGAQLSWRQRLGVKAAARLAHRRFVTTEYQRTLARACGIDTEEMTLGAEPDLFPLVARTDGPPWRLLHVGSINPVKDHDMLLRAFRLLRDRGVDTHLDIVGEDTMQGRVQALATSLGLDGRVTFHGRVVHADLARFYQQAHLFVLSSRHEAAATVVLEAALTGLPVVGSNVGYIADWAPDRAEAVSPRDPGALASAIEALLANPSRRQTMGTAARLWASARDARATLEKLELSYAELKQR